jgi:hypothetical protein
MGATRKAGVIGANSRSSGLVTRMKNRLKKNLLSSGRNSRMPNRPISVHMIMPST